MLDHSPEWRPEKRTHRSCADVLCEPDSQAGAFPRISRRQTAARRAPEVLRDGQGTLGCALQQMTQISADRDRKSEVTESILQCESGDYPQEVRNLRQETDRRPGSGYPHHRTITRQSDDRDECR